MFFFVKEFMLHINIIQKIIKSSCLTLYLITWNVPYFSSRHWNDDTLIQLPSLEILRLTKK